MISGQQNYLNWYLNQANCGYGSSLGMYGGNCEYSLGTFVGMTLTSVIGNLLCGSGGFGSCQYSSFGGGYSSGGGGGSTPTVKTKEQQIKEIDKKINEQKSRDAESEVNPRYESRIKTIDLKLEPARTAQKHSIKCRDEAVESLSTYTAKMNEIENIPVNNRTEAQNKLFESYKETIDNLRQQIATYNGDKDTKDSIAYYQKIIDDGLEEMKKIEEEKSKEVQEVATEIANNIKELEAKKTEIEKTPDMSVSDMDDVLDDADGNWIERKFKGTRGDMMQEIRNFRKAKQEYDSLPNTDENTSRKGSLLTQMKKSAGELQKIYNGASKIDIEKIKNDKTLQMGWNTIKKWQEQQGNTTNTTT